MPSSPSSTAFILVPGGYCLASLYRRVTDRLRDRGYEAIEIDHPTIVDKDNGTKTFYDDAANIRQRASDLMDQGKDVVIVGNSFGGFLITEAVKYLSESERQAAGKSSGGVLKNMLLFGSLLPPPDITCNELTRGIVPDVIKEGEAAVLDPPSNELGASLIMTDLSKEEQLQWADFRPQAGAAFNKKTTHVGYLHVPTTYVITENDKAVDPKLQHESFDKAVAAGGRDIVKKSVQSDHCVMISHPDELVEILIEAAGDGAKSS